MILKFLQSQNVQPTPGDDWWYGSPVAGASPGSLFRVSGDGALRVLAVYACVRLLSSIGASLPLSVYRRLEPRGREKLREHPVYFILHDQPNPNMTAFCWKSFMLSSLYLRGNAYSWIERDPNTNVVSALWPIHPDACQPRVNVDGLVYYETLPNRQRYPADQILHFKLLTTDGVTGLSPIQQATLGLQLSQATELFGARFFMRGIAPAGVLLSPGKLNQEAVDALREEFDYEHGGVYRSHRPMILQNGVEWKPLGIKPDEAQFLDTRKFQRSEIAMLYGVPPHLIGDTEKSTSWGTGIEQQNIGFLTYTLSPVHVMMEQELNAKLFPGEQGLFVEHNVNALLRSDAASRAQFYRTMRELGVLNADDILDRENENPLPDGKGQPYWRPANYVEVQSGGELTAIENTEYTGVQHRVSGLAKLLRGDNGNGKSE